MAQKMYRINPNIKPILVHLSASLLNRWASSNLSAVKAAFTLAAYTIPTMPKGKQQKMVIRMASSIHVFGQIFVSIMYKFRN
jgi:hypothetical protein